jgi:glutamate racemase
MHSDPACSEVADVPCIGVFDSGVGGLSVLRALHRRMPDVSMVYVGDVAYAPYGERPTAQVVARCEQMVAYLAAQGARLIVVACNTATVLGIEWLRRRWPELDFVGVEPGVKPAAARSGSRRIAVLATPATASSARLQHLITMHAAGVHVHVQPCAGLAGAIESGIVRGDKLIAVLKPLCDRVRAAEVDTVILGCTHYPFVADSIEALLGEGVVLIDTGAAIAERVAAVWSQVGGSDPSVAVRLVSTGATDTMQLLLRQCPGLEATTVESLAL